MRYFLLPARDVDTLTTGYRIRRRNVCLSWLLGECRSGDECVYAHDKEYLPPQGWWTDDVRLSRLRGEFATAVREAPLDFGEGPVEECILAEALKPLDWVFDLWYTAEYEHDADDRMYNEPPSAREDEDAWMDTEEGDLDAETFEGEYPQQADDYDPGEAAINEMLMYGIKPYDDGAWVCSSQCVLFRALIAGHAAIQEELKQIQHITGSGRRR